MTELQGQAFNLIETLRIDDAISYGDYCLLFDALDEVRTVKEYDEVVEELWEKFADVPMDPNTECMETKFLHFPAGTSREEIWHWFDERHSKGIAYLLYRDGVDRTDEFVRLCYLKQLCDDCESESCAYHSDGVCRFPLVHGRKPAWTDCDGCIDYTAKGDQG